MEIRNLFHKAGSKWPTVKVANLWYTEKEQRADLKN